MKVAPINKILGLYSILISREINDSIIGAFGRQWWLAMPDPFFQASILRRPVRNIIFFMERVLWVI